jgi:hypothetical protein
VGIEGESELDDPDSGRRRWSLKRSAGVASVLRTERMGKRSETQECCSRDRNRDGTNGCLFYPNLEAAGAEG